MNHFGRLLQMEFTVIEPGLIEYRMPVREEILATVEAAHGGALAGLMDGIMGVAALSSVADEGKLVATLEFKISYLLPALLGDQLSGTGRVIRKGKRIVFAEGEIKNQKGEVLAKGSGTFSAYPYQAAKK